MGMPNSYRALRTANITYVEYENGDREFYDRRTDPAEVFNRAPLLTGEDQARLSARSSATAAARARGSCWSPARPAASRRASNALLRGWDSNPQPLD